MRYFQMFGCVFLIAFIFLDSINSFPNQNNFDKRLFTEILLNDTEHALEKRHNHKSAIAAVGAALGLLCDFQFRTAQSCTIDVKQLAYSHALIIDPEDHTKFLYPDERGLIRFRENDPVFISCPGENNFIKDIRQQSITLKCHCNTIFKYEIVYFNFNSLECDRPPENNIIQETINSPTETYYNIGFITDTEGRFLNLMRILYSDVTNTVWSRTEISMYLKGSQKTPKNRRFKQDYYAPGIKADYAYSEEVQARSLNSQSSCTDNNIPECSFINLSEDLVLNRGHLTPKSNFIYTAAGVATFAYLNSAPQWKTINANNWACIEKHVNKLATELELDLTVYTGTLGQFHVRNYRNKNLIAAYLYSDDYIQEIVIPLYFWKLVYSPEINKGIVFVTVNNPFARDFDAYKVCSDIKMTLNGAKIVKQWHPKSGRWGYSYACSVSDFAQFNNLSFDDFDASLITELLHFYDHSEDREFK